MEPIETDTELRKLNSELQDRVAELEQRVSELSDNLAAARDELESFTYSVSHDLRAPLRAIMGFAEIIEQEYADRLEDDAKEDLEIIRRSTQKMDSLLLDLLTISRLGRREINPVTIDAESLAREVFDELRETCPERTIEFTLGPGPVPPCRGDLALIRQLLTNYISNAIKFTRPCATAIIEFGGSEYDDKVVYYVRDNGVGFDMKHADRLFGVFQKLHKEQDFEGDGVGLAIAQRIARRHRGEVWAEGELDAGATFYLSLPPADRLE